MGWCKMAPGPSLMPSFTWMLFGFPLALTTASSTILDRAYVRRVLAPYLNVGKVNAFDKDILILPHITAHARHVASEFTAGSSSFQMNFPKLGIVGSDLFLDD
ncbi:hypothetical protein [Nitrospirillum sp. BR 11163]|uniref:hypothetical protein n=1 Tax=Nitrospirillum sp. BR 11163 TaxID=3104323 RepID=UPI002AFF274C|nr:hypothetical protein [Nitrospirillum sp. BR 11163]MEA1676460.1 hypothetical protein [Nitrospirillum sp. BR 11163]